MAHPAILVYISRAKFGTPTFTNAQQYVSTPYKLFRELDTTDDADVRRTLTHTRVLGMQEGPSKGQ